MNTIVKKLLPFLFAGASLVGCNSDFKKSEIPYIINSVQTTLSKDGKEISVYAVDDDNDRKIDRVFGDGYLMFYKEGNPEAFKEKYVPGKSQILNKTDEKILSKKLAAENRDAYVSDILERIKEDGREDSK